LSEPCASRTMRMRFDPWMVADGGRHATPVPASA
jgi:hypothetical protein